MDSGLADIRLDRVMYPIGIMVIFDLAVEALPRHIRSRLRLGSQAGQAWEPVD